LVSPFLIVGFKIFIQVRLYSIDGFIEFGVADNPEMFILQSAMQTFDDAVTLGPSDLDSSMLDILELQEELEGMLVGASAVLPAGVAED